MLIDMMGIAVFKFIWEADMRKSFRFVILTILLAAACVFLAPSESEAAGTYTIKINKQQNVVTVYKTKNGTSVPHKAFVCSAGTATPTGTFSLGEKLRWHVLDGPSYGQYCTRITGSILFHSVWYYKQTKDSQSYIQYNRLGTTASHGCVRLTVADAKWIYDNCPSGTKVVIYNSSNPGPLGKPSAIKVSGYSGWDPTDPDPANPYAKKKPQITGVKNKTLAYGEKFNPKKGIKVKNTTGFSAKKLLKLEIYYKLDATSDYKKVKTLNTKKPGKYKVIYKITDEIGRKAKKTAIIKVLSSVEVTSITLKTEKKTLYLGGKASQKKFTLKVKKISPAKATTKKVVYLTSDSSVATVSKKGVVKAKGPGAAVITVKAADGSGISATCRVTVKQYVSKITLTAPAKELDVGNAMQLRTQVLPSNASNPKVKYTSSDPEIAEVSASGSLRAKKPGTVTITAKATDGSGKKAVCTITIYYYYNSVVTETPASIAVFTGASWDTVTEKLLKQLTIRDRYGNEAQASVEWDSAGYGGIVGVHEISGKVILPAGWSGTVPDIKIQIITSEPESEKQEDENEQEL